MEALLCCGAGAGVGGARNVVAGGGDVGRECRRALSSSDLEGRREEGGGGWGVHIFPRGVGSAVATGQAILVVTMIAIFMVVMIMMV